MTQHARTSSPALDAPSIYWLAGLLEGEGTFAQGPPSSPRVPVLQVEMTDLDVVERAASLFGRACVAHPLRRGHTRPTYSTRVRGLPAVQVMTLLRPMLGVRRQMQVDRVVSAFAAAPGRSVRPDDAVGERARLLGDVHARHWLAGLLEAEGAFSSDAGYPFVRVHMCDRDVVARAAALMRVPVHDATRARDLAHGWRPSWAAKLSGARAADLMRELRPLMGSRRQAQIDRALAAYHPVRLARAPRTCVVAACARPHRSRGLCHAHYMRWSRNSATGRAPAISPLR